MYSALLVPQEHMKGPEEAVDVLQGSVRLRVSLFERRCLRDQMGSGGRRSRRWTKECDLI
jgi:hypothetical protein